MSEQVNQLNEVQQTNRTRIVKCLSGKYCKIVIGVIVILFLLIIGSIVGLEVPSVVDFFKTHE